MMNFTLPDVETALAAGRHEPLFDGLLVKAIEPHDQSEKPWRFAGIASDEDPDVQGDTILRKALDISYAKERGYVNWDHSYEPADQLGFLTDVVVINPTFRESLQKSLQMDVPETATLYVEGELHKAVPKAADVYNVLKSTTNPRALGLSVDGSMARLKTDRSIVKAMVRGVAFTAKPVHTKTMVQLAKSIQIHQMIGDNGLDLNQLGSAIAEQVLAGMRTSEGALRKSHDGGMTKDEAVMWVLRQRPNWTYDLAVKFVEYTISR